MESYLLLAKSTKGAAAAKIVSDATSAPGIYFFSELLAVPNIQALKDDGNNAKSYALLQLFAYGTLSDYNSAQESLPSLTANQLAKLRHLSLVSMALEKRALPYDLILSSLGLESERQLEDLVIDVIYAGLLKGKLHHHEKVLQVEWAAGRDVKEEDLPKIQLALSNWSATATALLSSLDAQISEIQQQAQAEKDRSQAYSFNRNETYNSILDKSSSRSRDNKSFPSNADMLGRVMNAKAAGGTGRVLGSRTADLNEESRTSKRQKD